MDLEAELDKLQDENAELRAEREKLQAWKDNVPWVELYAMYNNKATEEQRFSAVTWLASKGGAR